MKENWKWYIYILLCKDNSYYTGMTWCPGNRYEQHVLGNGCKYTSKYGVKQLVYLEEYEDLEAARMREKQIKGWTRKKKEKLINGEWGKEW